MTLLSRQVNEIPKQIYLHDSTLLLNHNHIRQQFARKGWSVEKKPMGLGSLPSSKFHFPYIHPKFWPKCRQTVRVLLHRAKSTWNKNVDSIAGNSWPTAGEQVREDANVPPSSLLPPPSSLLSFPPSVWVPSLTTLCVCVCVCDCDCRGGTHAHILTHTHTHNTHKHADTHTQTDTHTHQLVSDSQEAKVLSLWRWSSGCWRLSPTGKSFFRLCNLLSEGGTVEHIPWPRRWLSARIF